ncbi:MAG: hypothetical protein ACO4AZ_10805, partial [Ilumatobacteraceae bacterium]
MVAAGTCTIRASQTGNSNYNAATSVDRSFTISKAAQTITFSTSGAGTKTYGDSAFSLSATTTGTNSSGNALTVSFASTTPGVCSTGGSNGATVTIVAAGTCSLEASQAGNELFDAATPVAQSITIERKALTAPNASIASRTYNGTTTAGTITVGSLSGLVGSETLNVTASGSDYADGDVSGSGQGGLTSARVTST